ncbi:MAG: type II toxin-antitoxin system RelE/ParE family toxin [Candidatus Thiodiazotropha sp. (ex Lucinoma kastoroae)]|nr:type II toxin-antitoxin system RelE/ParE family toxin [Candidatus Thiodiazotropha sp. (ex Lucinoma kastoroae)]
MRVEWTAPALDDLAVIRDYIAKDSPHYARRFIERIFDAAEKLHDHPQMGRQVPEADLSEVRELIFQGYRIIHRIKPDQVQIVAVIHGARDLTATDHQPWNDL